MRPKILYKLFSNIMTIKGIGPKNAKIIERLCGKYIVDLLFHKPTAYIDRRNSPKIIDLEEGSIATVVVKIDSHTPAFNRRMPYRVNVSDDSGQMSIVYFNLRGPYIKKILPIGSTRVISGKIEKFNDLYQITHPHHVVDIKNLDSVKKIECVYPLTAGMTSKIIQKSINSALSMVDELPEWIPEKVLERNKWPSWKDSIYQMHNPKDVKENDDNKYIERLVFDELFSQQLTIRLIKNKISHKNGISLPKKNKLSKQLRDQLKFQLTGDQETTIEEISNDQEGSSKMLRLLQGDVGSGKTIVALFAMMQCIENNKRSVLMAPTEILAEQHFNTIKEFISDLNLTCSLITSSNKNNHNFEADIIIGTHALFQQKVTFENIGLVVIDEQHKFGVHQRILLNEKAGNSCDILLMTATPIPRTMELAAYGDMDISKISEKPKNRKEIITKSININKIDSVIEVGIDDPDATVMIIENSERYGLSQLHQLRGRVGRGNVQSTCILLFEGPLTDNAKRRLKVMKETNDGFLIAEEDLDIRGAGEILGSKQSGIPNFRLSNLDKHKHILEEARGVAMDIVKEDPDLKKSAGKAQRTLLHLFRNQVAIDYLKTG